MYPIDSWDKNCPNVGKSIIHGSYGIYIYIYSKQHLNLCVWFSLPIEELDHIPAVITCIEYRRWPNPHALLRFIWIWVYPGIQHIRGHDELPTQTSCTIIFGEIPKNITINLYQVWSPQNGWVPFNDPYTHLANGPWKKSLNFIFPTKYGIPKSSKG